MESDIQKSVEKIDGKYHLTFKKEGQPDQKVILTPSQTGLRDSNGIRHPYSLVRKID